MTPHERFMAKVRESPGPLIAPCWRWTAALWHNGYARFKVNGAETLGHRFAYETFVGPIPEGLQLDHLCRNRACVNPSHLEPVSRRENILRGESPAAMGARLTHCPQGHPYAGDNLMVTSAGRRRCRVCTRAGWRRSTATYQKKRAARSA